jgi:hypothetical protein
LQWLQEPSVINRDNWNNIRHEISRHFRNEKSEYLKDKINESPMNSKNKNIKDLYRGINDFKRGHQPRSNLVKNENGDLRADSHNIDVRQIQINTARPLLPNPSPFEIETAIAKLKRYKSTTGIEILRSKIHKLIKILFGIRKNCLISGSSLLLYQFTRRVIKLTVVIILGYNCYQLHTTFYPIFYSQC